MLTRGSCALLQAIPLARPRPILPLPVFSDSDHWEQEWNKTSGRGHNKIPVIFTPVQRLLASGQPQLIYVVSGQLLGSTEARGEVGEASTPESRKSTGCCISHTAKVPLRVRARVLHGLYTNLINRVMYRPCMDKTEGH